MWLRPLNGAVTGIHLRKKSIVEETQEPGKSISYVARQHNISPSLILDGGVNTKKEP